MEEAVGERRKAFDAAHRSDEDRQSYISASRRASSVIAKAKAEAWHTTCSSLSPKSNPKSVYSLLRSVAGSFSSSSSSPIFSTVFLLDSQLWSMPLTLDPTFPFLSQRPCVAEPEAIFLLCRAMCPEESHSSFCSPFFSAECLAVASNLSLSTATGPDKVADPMLKHLPRSGMNFLFYIFNLPWTSHSFPSIWKTSSIIPIHKMRKPLDCPTSFRPISLTSCVSKLLERIILSRPLFFLESNSILPARPVCTLDGLLQIKFCIFLSPFRMGLTNPDRALGRSCLLLICRKLLTLSGIPLFSTNSLRLAFLLALLVGLNFSFLIGALAWFIKITKAVSFGPVEVFCKDSFLALYFSLF